MATISVPLSAELEQSLDSLVHDGVGSSRADIMRQALSNFIESTAVLAVLKAEQEVSEGKILRGDTRSLLFGS